MKSNTKKIFKIVVYGESGEDLKIIEESLSDRFEIICANEFNDIMYNVQKYTINVSLIILSLKNDKWFKALTLLNKNSITEYMPVLVTDDAPQSKDVERAIELGACDYLLFPFAKKLLKRRVDNVISLYKKQSQIISSIESLVYREEVYNRQIISHLARVIEFRGNDYSNHIKNIQLGTQILLKYLQKHKNYLITDDDILNYTTAASLHDIGKIYIDEKILTKPVKLTPEELEIAKQHTILGSNLLKKNGSPKNNDIIQAAYEIARWHHERYDGSGYPDKLVGDAIPISAQVVGLIDRFDVLTHDRVYKKPLSYKEAFDIIESGKLGQFNPILVECFRECENQIISAFENDEESVYNRAMIEDASDKIISDVIFNRQNHTTNQLSGEKEKFKFFTDDMEIIQFEYDILYPSISFSRYTAKLLGVEELIMSPNFAEQFGLSQNTIDEIKRIISETTPNNPYFDYEIELKVNGEIKKYKLEALIVWDYSDNKPKRSSFLGKLIELFDENSIDKNKANIIKASKEEFMNIYNSLNNVFDIVRVIDPINTIVVNLDDKEYPDCGSNVCYALLNRNKRCQRCVSLAAYRNKVQTSKYEFIGDDLYLVVSKYIEVDGQPYVLELINKDRESHSSLHGEKDMSDFSAQLYIDVLTRAYNRRFYEERGKKLKDIRSVAMFDCDDFKNINDNYGHAVGDVFLHHIAASILNCVTDEEVLIRYGGDEFILLSREKDEEVFKKHIADMQDKISTIKIAAYPNIKCSVTTGICFNASSIENAVDLADKQMYKGKMSKEK